MLAYPDLSVARSGAYSVDRHRFVDKIFVVKAVGRTAAKPSADKMLSRMRLWLPKSCSRVTGRIMLCLCSALSHAQRTSILRTLAHERRNEMHQGVKDITYVQKYEQCRKREMNAAAPALFATHRP